METAAERVTSALLVGLLAMSSLLACSSDGPSASGPEPSASTQSDLPSASTSHSASTSPSPATDLRDTTVYPFTFVDLRSYPRTDVAATGVLGAPPRVPWSEPPRWHLEGKVVSVPAPLFVHTAVNEGLVLSGGCTRTRCGRQPRGAIHLLTPDGTVKPLDPEVGRHSVGTVVGSPDGRAVAWASAADAGDSWWLYESGDSEAAQFHVLGEPSAASRAWPVGFLGKGDVVLQLGNNRGKALGFLRSSGKPAEWGARNISTPAPDVLLGEPAFTPRRETCLARFEADSSRPMWTRCYRWGERSADGFYSYSMTEDARWIATMVLNDLFILDGRTGQPTLRVRFTSRLQYVTFEDPTHVLAVVTAKVHNWIVRCTLELQCEQATDRIRIRDFGTLEFAPE